MPVRSGDHPVSAPSLCTLRVLCSTVLYAGYYCRIHYSTALARAKQYQKRESEMVSDGPTIPGDLESTADQRVVFKTEVPIHDNLNYKEFLVRPLSS
jgi:hypothetical protein